MTVNWRSIDSRKFIYDLRILEILTDMGGGQFTIVPTLMPSLENFQNSLGHIPVEYLSPPNVSRLAYLKLYQKTISQSKPKLTTLGQVSYEIKL